MWAPATFELYTQHDAQRARSERRRLLPPYEMNGSVNPFIGGQRAGVDTDIDHMHRNRTATRSHTLCIAHEGATFLQRNGRATRNTRITIAG